MTSLLSQFQEELKLRDEASQVQLQVRLQASDQLVKSVKMMLNAKSGAGATTNADFYDSMSPEVKSFLPRRQGSAQKMKGEFALIAKHERELIAQQKGEASGNEKKFQATESNMVQPLWSAYLGSGLTVDGAVLKFTDNKKIKGRSPTMRWEDRHKVPSIGTRRPDECLYIAKQPSTAYYIAVVGDLKNPGDDFTADAKGQILSFMLRLMQLQPFRQFVIGYLRNSAVIQFFCATRNGDDFTFEETPEYAMDGEGAELFADLLVAAPADLGWTVPSLPFEGLNTTDFLGRGASCAAYATNHATVVKIFHREPDMKRELENLAILAKCEALRGTVPAVIQSEGPFMEVSPIGKHYTEDLVGVDVENAELPQHAVFGRKHLGQLIDIIAASPLVHRDLHPGNAYIMEDGNLLLNDWGLAVEPGQKVAFVGVEKFVSFDVLDAKQAGSTYKALRKDDLLAIVRVAYRILHPHDFKRMDQETPAAFWKARLACGYWAAAETAAAADEPETLKALLKDLMPW
jgi:hypothetical protein